MNTTLSRLFAVSMDRLADGLRIALIALPILAAAPVRAEGLDYVSTVTLEEEWEEAPASFARLEAPAFEAPAAARSFGPFRVKGDVVELVGAVDADTPARFAAMLAAHPGLRRIEMIECPGSEDDDANLALARMVRKAGLETHVPAHGSIRSGGVELFLAGAKRSIAPGAELGVHSWADSDGLEATDYAADDPVHRPYLDFYTAMGMAADTARAFYDFTNRAAPFDGLHVMTRAEIERFGLVKG